MTRHLQTALFAATVILAVVLLVWPAIGGAW